MKYRQVRLEALGYELAPVVVSSADLEDRLAPVFEKLRIPHGQLAALTGIDERRWWEPETPLSWGAARAAEQALAESGVAAREIDVLIYAGVCREQFEPATACRVAHQLGVSSGAAIFDISNACLGVLNGILEVANRIELGQIRAGLIVSCESAREINDITIDRLLRDPSHAHFAHALATFTGGSGAAAVLLTDGSFGDARPRFLGGVHENAPEHHRLCRWGLRPASALGEHEEHMETDSVKVLEHGVALGARTWQSLLAELDWTTDAVDRVVCHQVGSAHQQTILETIGVPMEKDFVTYPFLGNIGTVSLPITAALAAERGLIRRGQRVAWLGIGSGLNCLMQGWEW